jgi:hypothetical protein
MNVNPGDGPGHSRSGPCHRPRTEQPPWAGGLCVPSFSRTCKVSFAPCGSDCVPHYNGRCGRLSASGVAGCGCGCPASAVARVGRCIHPPTCLSRPAQPTGGSESVERAERASAVFASAVGPARATSDRTEGGPTGTTGLVCGRGGGRGRRGGGCSGGGAYRTLPYAAAMVRLCSHGRYSASTPIRGVSA